MHQSLKALSWFSFFKIMNNENEKNNNEATGTKYETFKNNWGNPIITDAKEITIEAAKKTAEAGKNAGHVVWEKGGLAVTATTPVVKDAANKAADLAKDAYKAATPYAQATKKAGSKALLVFLWFVGSCVGSVVLSVLALYFGYESGNIIGTFLVTLTLWWVFAGAVLWLVWNRW